MTRYFFGLVDETGLSPDDMGADFPTLEDAYLEACHAALEISFEMLRERRDPTDLRFEITDRFGRLLMEVPFAEVLRPGLKASLVSAASKATIELSRARREARRRLTAELSGAVANTNHALATTRALLTRSGAPRSNESRD